MPNSFTKATHTSYGRRIKNSIAGILIGLLLFVVSFVVLWKNEENGARLAKQENYISKNAIDVQSDNPLRENDEKLIATSGKLLTEDSLADENLMIRKALVLKRDVEMYQWVEHKKSETKDEMGGSSTTTTTYTYTKEWNNLHIDSSRFKQTAGHQNPDFPIASLRLNAQNATLGKYIASELQTSSINELTTITNLPQNSMYEFIDGKYYSKGASPSSPNVGDIRISYFYAPSGANISLIGQQNSDNTISQHPTKYGKIYWQEDGINDKYGMLKNIKASNSFLTNIFRFVGWLLMFIGLLLISGPFSAVLKFIPTLGSITGFLSGVIALFISMILSLVTIGIAWFAYRPLSAIFLFILAGGIVYIVKSILDKHQYQIPIEYTQQN